MTSSLSSVALKKQSRINFELDFNITPKHNCFILSLKRESAMQEIKGMVYLNLWKSKLFIFNLYSHL